MSSPGQYCVANTAHCAGYIDVGLFLIYPGKRTVDHWGCLNISCSATDPCACNVAGAMQGLIDYMFENWYHPVTGRPYDQV